MERKQWVLVVLAIVIIVVTIVLVIIITINNFISIATFKVEM